MNASSSPETQGFYSPTPLLSSSTLLLDNQNGSRQHQTSFGKKGSISGMVVTVVTPEGRGGGGGRYHHCDSEIVCHSSRTAPEQIPTRRKTWTENADDDAKLFLLGASTSSRRMAPTRMPPRRMTWDHTNAHPRTDALLLAMRSSLLSKSTSSCSSRSSRSSSRSNSNSSNIKNNDNRNRMNRWYSMNGQSQSSSGPIHTTTVRAFRRHQRQES